VVRERSTEIQGWLGNIIILPAVARRLWGVRNAGQRAES
jgi:hypothetical protein